jgi:hypothetical protein
MGVVYWDTVPRMYLEPVPDLTGAMQCHQALQSSRRFWLSF